MAPYDIIAELGKPVAYLIFLLIGIGFGYSLEISGFGDSRKLAAQFYFKDMRVLKVMFTGIVVAMTLIFLSSAVGLLDFDRVYVNLTYLWPGIVGGLIMGVGFIVGGFCPGTSIVALSTLKVDGMVFVAGVAFGVMAFGETVFMFDEFANSSFLGRFTLPELFNASYGLIVLAVVFMALGMFYGAELLEQYFGEGKKWDEIVKVPSNRVYRGLAVALVLVAAVAWIIGQPDVDQKWNQIKAAEMEKIENREIYIHPMELLQALNDPMLYQVIIDVRKEPDFNLFHLEDARNATFEELRDQQFIKVLKRFPSNTLFAVVSNDEKRATEAYKILRAQKVINVYILEGGINNWLNFFPLPDKIATEIDGSDEKTDGTLDYRFTRAVGDEFLSSSNPKREFVHGGQEGQRVPKVSFKEKIKIQKKTAISGGCG